MSHEAIERVKVGEFLRRGYKISGLVHIGANEGYEVQWYLKLGIAPILCFEPLEEACEKFLRQYGGENDVELVHIALGNIEGEADLHVTQGDGQGSSLLPGLPTEYFEVRTDRVEIERFADWADGNDYDPDLFNTLVIDVQGTELDVLRGMDDLIASFKLLNIELSATPVYSGGAFAVEVITYLERFGFLPITPVEPHNDVLFIREDVHAG